MRVRVTIVVVEKAINITYSDWVFGALGTQHVMRMRRIICGMHAPLYNIFSTLSHKRHDFRKKKVIKCKMFVLIFSTKFIGNISHSKKN